jgi:hypothetical protein
MKLKFLRTIKMKNILAKGKALVARVKPHRNEDNFDWALPEQKGTVK